MSANILIGQSKSLNQTQSQGTEIYTPLPHCTVKSYGKRMDIQFYYRDSVKN